MSETLRKYGDLYPAVPIWLNDGGEDDEYADFFPEVDFLPGVSYVLRISSDTDYNILIDGRLCGFGRYSDYPGRVIFDEYELDAKPGSKLTLRAWHSGVNSFTHVRGKAYIIFALFADGKPVCGGCSSPRTLSAPSAPYVPHKKKLITSQMGAGFTLDLTQKMRGPLPSAEVDLKPSAVLPRPNRKLETGEQVKCVCVRSGRYQPDGGDDAAQIMQKAKTDTDEGGYYSIFDAGLETVGFPLIEFDAAEPGEFLFGWGEHLDDGRCRTSVGGRAFAFSCRHGAGKISVFPSFRRLGCRYLQFFSEKKPENLRVSFVPVIYPVKLRNPELRGERRRIWNAAVRTLECCMHEHYEDCPWREQALYALDSRNQMLTGYSAFEDGNLEMVRASLDLISRGVRADGLLSLCYPAGLDRPIPLYSLAYFIQFREYVEFSGDADFAAEKYPILKSIMDSVLSRMIKDGHFKDLCPRYPDSAGYWNFYEWSPSMSGSHYPCDESDPPCEAPFNAALSMALDSLSKIARAAKDAAGAAKYEKLSTEVSAAVGRVFRRADGLFSSFTDRSDAPVSVLTQAMCLLCGAADGLDNSSALRLIENDGGDGSIPATLSMACFRYDAMLRENAEKYSGVILSEIDRDCSMMLSRGSATFWETLLGSDDFGGAGSLCHGWSAMAVHYYRLLAR